MAFLRPRRRRIVRRRRPAARRMRRVRRIGRNPRIHAPKKFVETIQLVNLESVPGVTNGTGYNFKVFLNQLTNPTALAGVFQQYCITGLKYMFIPRYNVAYLDADEGVQMPQLFIAENKFDTTVPASESEMLQEDNLAVLSASKRWSKYISKPKAWLAQSVEGTASLIQAQTGARFITWLPMDENGRAIDHLALRCWAQGNNTASTFVLGTVYVKVYYSLKEQH